MDLNCWRLVRSFNVQLLIRVCKFQIQTPILLLWCCIVPVLFVRRKRRERRWLRICEAAKWVMEQWERRKEVLGIFWLIFWVFFLFSYFFGCRSTKEFGVGRWRWVLMLKQRRAILLLLFSFFISFSLASLFFFCPLLFHLNFSLRFFFCSLY